MHPALKKPTMMIDPPISLESESVMDGIVISVSLLIVGESGGQVCRDKAKLRVRVIHADSDRSLVARHAGHASLLHAALDVLDVTEDRRLHEDTESCADELPAPKQNIILAPSGASVIVQALSDRDFPCLFPGGIAIHDLLWTQFDYLLEPHGHDLRILLGCVYLGA